MMEHSIPAFAQQGTTNYYSLTLRMSAVQIELQK